VSYHSLVDGKRPRRRAVLDGARMERHVQRLTSTSASPRARLWLAAADGRLLPPTPVPPIDGPELTMAVRFEGLSEDEQKAALAAFPGGRRFVLAG
jgi:hypothetical protein